MAKERLFDLPETKGTFRIRGKITGHDKEMFYKESKTKSGKTMRRTSFGVEYDKGKNAYVVLQGMPQDNVYFSKSVKKGEKSEVKKIPWAERLIFKEEGYRLIGNNIGVTKTVNAKGEYENVKKVLTDFDSVKEIADNLKDGDSVFIQGKLDYSSFTTDENETKHSIKLVPTQVSLCKSEIDFSSEDFNPIHDFTQIIVFKEIEQEKEGDKFTGRFVMNADIVNYQSIESAEFVVKESNLAKLFKKNLSPYTAIKVWGEISSKEQVEEIQSDNIWGETNKMEKQNTPFVREFIVTGADPTTIDKTTYTESKIEEAKIKVKNAQAAKNDFGTMADNNSAWGSVPGLGSEDLDEDMPW